MPLGVSTCTSTIVHDTVIITLVGNRFALARSQALSQAWQRLPC